MRIYLASRRPRVTPGMRNSTRISRGEKRLPDGMFPVEWTNAKTTDRVASHGTYADWGPRGARRGNPLVTVDALRVLSAARRERW